MSNFMIESAGLVWPLALALAWVLGELAFKWIGLPRVATYSLTGFVLSYAQAGILPRPSESNILLLANIAFGLILFEFGYRINLRWLRTNRWIGATGLLESVATFAAVYAVATMLGMPAVSAMLLASLAIATSPAELMRVVNDEHGAGQVTERSLHLAALNCVIAVFAFNIIVGLWTFQSSGSLWGAISNSALVLVVSAALGGTLGIAVPGLLRKLGALERHATVAFAVAVILLVALAQALKVSPVVAALIFGIMARHRRVTLSPAQRNFGVLGDLLMVLLFVFVGAALAWPRVLSGLNIALALFVVRLAAKIVGSLVFARISGTSWRKGLLTGVALAPMSVLAVSLLVQTRYIGIDLVDQLAPLAAATLLSAVAGPILTQRALLAAGEARDLSEQ
ncbi:cation:proton antiporter [Noviherbaspirillum sp. UKPF54]|uniref:cation:proton antiporter n=1 Tax=Noviherbaspirillum sp. UKPF54 TaxID=2601898 RepID=UPI0011B1C153|nr:cation:proton antiporter [Noviherbaspirillum sp. UKPF54]QDZ27924.1 sodium:proton antiporter [Noviherbaspirillum sp. UKPF54]